MQHINRINRELKYSGKLFEVYSDTISIPNGNIAHWDFIKHKGAAAVIPITDDGKVVMVRQYRNALDRETLEIPAGGLNPDEPTIDAAARELEEETGYRSNDLELLITVATTVAFCNEKIDIYLARNLIQSKQNLDEDEYVEVEEYTVDELTDMIYAGKINDSKTISAIMAYKDKYVNLK